MFTKLSIGWSSGTSLVSLGIKKLDKGPFSHTYLKFEFNDAPTLIYESHLSGGVQITPYVQLVKAIENGKVDEISERVLSTVPEKIEKIWKKATTLHGDSYDTLRIISYFIWIRYFKRKDSEIIKAFNNGKYTCNEFVITVCRAGIKEFNKLDFSYTPNALWNYFNANS